MLLEGSIEDFDADGALEKLDWILAHDVGDETELQLKRTKNYLSDFQYDEAAQSIQTIIGKQAENT